MSKVTNSLKEILETLNEVEKACLRIRFLIKNQVKKGCEKEAEEVVIGMEIMDYMELLKKKENERLKPAEKKEV